jgi:hypothetical protein
LEEEEEEEETAANGFAGPTMEFSENGGDDVAK